jgi:hypothetical protein
MASEPPRRQLPVWLEESDFSQATGYWAHEVTTGVERLDLLVKHPFGPQDRMMAIAVRRDRHGKAVPVGMALDPRHYEANEHEDGS